VRGVDTSAAMIERAVQLDRAGLDLRFELIKEASDVDEPQAYDAILCSSVIEYADPDGLLEIFNRVLRKPGVLIISFANKSSLWRRYWEKTSDTNPMFTPDHQTWNWAGFKQLLTKHGFRPTSAPRFFESPCDAWTFGSVFRRIALVGSIGIVAAETARDGD
jgi:SAM-dependent methyltransferase